VVEMIIRNLTRKFSVECEVAKTLWKQGVGLSFSRKKRNMLFIMPLERHWEFWTLGMRYPIKIVFIDKNKHVISVQKAVPLTLNPKTWKIYRPDRHCKYVLELGKDIRKKFEIMDMVKW